MTVNTVDAVLIAGPTASGKSAAALAVAERLRGTIVNADSMQVYAELSVLTARPGAAEQARAPHRLYGHVSVRERYSAGRYQDDAARALAETRAAGRIPIFTGGTGLYFSVLTEGLAPIPPVPAEVRAANRRRFEKEGAEAFFREFARRDPATAARLRTPDTQRVLRAADVLDATGRSLSVWQKSAGKPVLEGLRLARFVLAPPRELLYQRIERRFNAMMENGALEEARALSELDPALPAARALGVPQLLHYVKGEITRDAAVADTLRETRNYAKRQLTWFRQRMADWRWIHEPDARAIVVDLSLWDR